MSGVETLRAITLAVDLLQAITSTVIESQKISALIAKRIQENRAAFTDDEIADILASVAEARGRAVDAVERAQ